MSCASQDPAPATRRLDDDAITVASFDFAESELLAELYSQVLEHEGFAVERAFGLGPREFVVPALAGGLIEVVPEYSGTAVRFLSDGAVDPGEDAAATHAALQREAAGVGSVALAPAEAQDTNAFVVSGAIADEHELANLSDLAEVAPDLVFGGPPECPSRPLCLLGLEEIYDVRFAEVVALDAGGALTHQALANRDVQVALLFSTDPAIDGDGLVELVDDRGLQPAENVTPLVRTEVLERFGDGVTRRLDAVSGRLTTAVLRGLNAELAAGSDELATVAERWLEREGLT